MSNTHERKELEIYSKAIEELASSGSSLPFDNKNHKHASVVIANIFNFSEKEIVFYEDNFSGNISNNDDVKNIKNALINFIARKGKLILVLTQKRDINEELSQFGRIVKILNGYIPKNVIVKHASKTFNDKIFEVLNKESFFIVGDKKMYRIENVERDDSNNRVGAAVGSFNNIEESQKLYSLFMNNLDTCEDYFIKS